jgi:hypothetical protein
MACGKNDVMRDTFGGITTRSTTKYANPFNGVLVNVNFMMKLNEHFLPFKN